MIHIPDLGEDAHSMWAELMSLSDASVPEWTLIGAHMVTLHGWAKGREQVRRSRDADVLVNARAVTDATKRFSKILVAHAFQLDGVSPEGVAHRFRKDAVSLDVLAPDGVGPRADLSTLGGGHTLEVPGGTQALRRSSEVQVTSRDREGTIPLPSLLGALLIKIRAIEIDDTPEAQELDVAFLLSLVEDPDVLTAELKRSERGWLRRHPEFENRDADCYRDTPDPSAGAIVYRRLVAGL